MIIHHTLHLVSTRATVLRIQNLTMTQDVPNTTSIPLILMNGNMNDQRRITSNFPNILGNRMVVWMSNIRTLDPYLTFPLIHLFVETQRRDHTTTVKTHQFRDLTAQLRHRNALFSLRNLLIQTFDSMEDVKRKHRLPLNHRLSALRQENGLLIHRHGSHIAGT